MRHTSSATHRSLHIPVLLKEAIHALNIDQGGLYIDATYGRGGHAQAILTRLGTNGCLIALDRDQEAVEHAKANFAHDPRCHIRRAQLKDIDSEFAALNLNRHANGVLADLGVSSPQLDDAQRGFSFMQDGPLDMRMDVNSGMDAATWLSLVGESELTQVLREYGEERFAKRIARAIIKRRQSQPITRTKQLADLVAAVVPSREKNKHPATRTFQAVRMRINSELDQLNAFLPKAVKLLAVGGRLVVVSFHSLEDRLVKRFMREQARGDNYPSNIPVPASQVKPLLRLVGKAVKPSASELERNPRARSAVLRVAERTRYCYA